MIKRWLVKCCVNMDMGTEVNAIVHANTERKAKGKAINKCYNKGYFHATVLSCKEMEERSDT